MNLCFPKWSLQYFFTKIDYLNLLNQLAVLYPSAESQSRHSQEFKLDLFARIFHGFKLRLLFLQKVPS